MKIETFIKIYLTVSITTIIVFFILLIRKPTKTVVVEKSSRAYNDSVLVTEYQEALLIYIEKHPKAAAEFMDILEQINTK